MKEWANKPSALTTTSSAPVNAVSSSSAVQGGSSSLTLTSGSSTTVASSSSGVTTAGSGIGAKAAIAAALASPLAAGVTAGAIGVAAYGTSNIIKCKKKQKTGKRAAKDTAVNSAGIGTSAGLGIAAVNVVSGTFLAMGSTVVVPIAAGVGVAYASIKIWNKMLHKAKKTSKSK